MEALYYPTIGIRVPSTLADALVLWDSMTCITPRPCEGSEWARVLGNYPDVPTDKKTRDAMIDAHVQYIHGYAPGEEQKRNVHEEIERVTQSRPADWLLPRNINPQQKYTILNQKMHADTYSLLVRSKLAERAPKGIDVHGALGLFLMATIAKHCSGPALPPFTEDSYAFVCATNTVLQAFGARSGVEAYVPHKRAGKVSQSLLTLLYPALGIDASKPQFLQKLLKAKSDRKFSSSRDKFLATVHKFIDDIQACTSAAEVDAKRRDFKRAVDRDRAELKQELISCGLFPKARKLVITTVGGGILGSLTTLAGMSLAPAVSVGVGVGVWAGYRIERRETIDRHWTGWLWNVTRGTFTWY